MTIALYLSFSLMRFYQFFDQRQSNGEPAMMAFRRTIRLAKTIPYVGQKVGRNTLACIFNFDCYPACDFQLAVSSAILVHKFRSYFNLTACRSELDGIG